MPELTRFLGLDLRSGIRSAGALQVADNVRIDSRGSCVRRPGLARQATLPEGTAGLYAMDDTLRAVAPNGTSTSGLHPAIYLDYIEADSVAGRVRACRLPSGRRLLWVESVNGGPAHLHCTDRVVETPRSGSRIDLPWVPTDLVMPAGTGRPFALDRARGLLLWGGIADPDVNDGEGYIRTWAATGAVDASQEGGFTFASQAGSEPRGLAEYQGQVAVLALGAVQIVEVGAAGAVSATTIAGPGTRHPGAIATMSGDLLYVDGGGRVRLLSQDAGGGGAGEDAIGEPVTDLSAPMTGYSDTPTAIYARSMGCYLLASGTSILCLSVLPGVGRLGWSRWPMPIPIDAIAECRGTVHLRSGRAVYGLYDHLPDDEVDTGDRRPIDMTVEPAELGKGQSLWTPSRAWVVGAAGDMHLRVRADGIASPPGVLPSRAPRPSIRRGAWPGARHSVRVHIPAAPAGARIDTIGWE